jgi:SOS response regulatory protein OraA/RecX
MVFTRQMLSSAQAASETEKESDWAELKTDRKTRVIAKEGRISKRTLRKNIKGKLVKNGFKRSKVIRFDN